MKDYEDQFDIADPWHIVQNYMDNRTNLTLKVEGVVNGGVIVKVEGLRGFVPASRLSLSYIEDLESYLLKEITVRVIEADPEEHRLILSAREILKEEEARERAERISKIQVGSVMEGTVESIQSYGAFVRFDDGLSGLVHVSQICEKRIKNTGRCPEDRRPCQCQSHRNQRWKTEPEYQSSFRRKRRRDRRTACRASKIRRDRNKSWRSFQKYQTVILLQTVLVETAGADSCPDSPEDIRPLSFISFSYNRSRS